MAILLGLGFDGGDSATGSANMTTKEGQVIGEDAAMVSAAGNGDVELFPMHCGQGTRRRNQDDLIDRFALSRMRGDCVSVGKGAISRTECPTILQPDVCAFKTTDFDQFAIDDSWRIGAKEEPLTHTDGEIVAFSNLHSASVSADV